MITTADTKLVIPTIDADGLMDDIRELARQRIRIGDGVINSRGYVTPLGGRSEDVRGTVLRQRRFVVEQKIDRYIKVPLPCGLDVLLYDLDVSYTGRGIVMDFGIKQR